MSRPGEQAAETKEWLPLPSRAIGLPAFSEKSQQKMPVVVQQTIVSFESQLRLHMPAQAGKPVSLRMPSRSLFSICTCLCGQPVTISRKSANDFGSSHRKAERTICRQRLPQRALCTMAVVVYVQRSASGTKLTRVPMIEN